jgi:hypothetical protein
MSMSHRIAESWRWVKEHPIQALLSTAILVSIPVSGIACGGGLPDPGHVSPDAVDGAEEVTTENDQTQGESLDTQISVAEEELEIVEDKLAFAQELNTQKREQFYKAQVDGEVELQNQLALEINKLDAEIAELTRQQTDLSTKLSNLRLEQLQ